MQKRRFNLPPLDLIQGFEAAARNLSFTKAAEELFITQSAVSRQIRALEEHLSVALFERRHRALVLTEQGRIMQRAATELLERLQEVTDRLRSAYLRVGRYTMWALLAPTLLLMIYARPLIQLYVGSGYETASIVMMLLLR